MSLISTRQLAEEILQHIREGDLTPEQGAADYDLQGDEALEVVGLIYEMTEHRCDGDGRTYKRRRRL